MCDYCQCNSTKQKCKTLEATNGPSFSSKLIYTLTLVSLSALLLLSSARRSPSLLLDAISSTVSLLASLAECCNFEPTSEDTTLGLTVSSHSTTSPNLFLDCCCFPAPFFVSTCKSTTWDFRSSKPTK